jgi:hypothetical protein
MENMISAKPKPDKKSRCVEEREFGNGCLRGSTFHRPAAVCSCSAFGNVPSGGKINKGNCIAFKEDFGMPVAEYEMKGFFEPVMSLLQD